MRLGVAVGVVVIVAGCSSPKLSPFELVDARGDAAPRFDLLRANLTELPGSLALAVEVANFAEGLPFFEARLEHSAGVHYARLVPDPTRAQAPQARAETGRWADGQRLDASDACWFPSFPGRANGAGPWLLVVELLHNRTGLASGDHVLALGISMMNETGVVQDEGSHRGAFRVGGGSNPYLSRVPDCPLFQHRERFE